MNFPIQFGVPQIILLLIALCGLGLFLVAIVDILKMARFATMSEEDKKEYYYQTGRLPRHRIRWKRGIGGIILMLFAVSLLWMAVLIQSYIGLTGEIKVAHVHATKVTNPANPNIPQMSVELILYDSNGHQTSDSTYILSGDEWMLQGDIIKVVPWLNIFGLHSGYKLTRLEGRFDDINLENTVRHTAIPLNGGDDNFFKTMHANSSWISPFIDAAYGNAVFQTPGNYDVFATQDALIARQTS